MNVKPIYGWGWFQESAIGQLDVPEPFSVNVHSASETEVLGSVEAPHVFSGMSIRLGLRSEAGGQKHWNVYVTQPEQGQITGFAEST